LLGVPFVEVVTVGLLTDLYRSVMGKRGRGRRLVQQREEGVGGRCGPSKSVKRIRANPEGAAEELGAEEVMCTLDELVVEDNTEDIPTKPAKSKALAHIGGSGHRPPQSTKQKLQNPVSQREKGRLEDRIRELEARLRATEGALSVVPLESSVAQSAIAPKIQIQEPDPLHTYNWRQPQTMQITNRSLALPVPPVHVHVHLSPSPSKWKQQCPSNHSLDGERPLVQSRQVARNLLPEEVGPWQHSLFPHQKVWAPGPKGSVCRDSGDKILEDVTAQLKSTVEVLRIGKEGSVPTDTSQPVRKDVAAAKDVCHESHVSSGLPEAVSSPSLWDPLIFLPAPNEYVSPTSGSLSMKPHGAVTPISRSHAEVSSSVPRSIAPLSPGVPPLPSPSTTTLSPCQP
jgi:hypothetical protein